MPPGSINPANIMAATRFITIEKTVELLVKFETCRKSSTCPQCARQGVFCRNGSTKTELPQLIFRCNGCNASYRASTMRSIVQSFISDSLYLSSTEEVIKTSRHSQETPNRTLNQPQEDIQTLLTMIRRTNRCQSRNHASSCHYYSTTKSIKQGTLIRQRIHRHLGRKRSILA